MNLNNIELPPFIVKEWYKDALLTLPGEDTASIQPVSPASQPSTGSAPRSTLSPTPSASTPSASASPATSPPLGPVNDHPTLKSLGSNRHNITLLVHAPGTPFLPDNQLAFLTKLLEACHLTLADVAIVNNAATPVMVADIRQQLNPKTILLFGPEPTAIRLPINFPAFRPQEYDGCTYLAAPGLDKLVTNTEESKLLKSKLWVCLKTIFSI